jgi:hypothetical protein
MQQRQLRLGDILDDYCPRERRVTNHAVVAMVGADVKQTRCTTCDAEHEYKHAKVPRQRRKAETPAALYSQVLASGPKRVAHEELGNNGHNHAAASAEVPTSARGSADAGEDDALDAPQQEPEFADEHVEAGDAGAPMAAAEADAPDGDAIDHESQSLAAEDSGDTDEAGEEGHEDEESPDGEEEGPVHRPLIRASLPRPEGTPPPTRPIPEFTIRQPGGRPNRFRPRHQRGGQQQQQFGNRSNGNVTGGPPRGGMRQGGGRPPQGNMPRAARRHGPPGRKRSK